jgi:hypothetical protein
MSVADAYGALGTKSVNPKKQGEKIAALPQVQARIRFLKGAVTDAQIQGSAWDREQLLQELKKNVSLAREVDQISAANKAIELYGSESHGMFKKETIVRTGKLALLEGYTDEQLYVLIENIGEELGLDFKQTVHAIRSYHGRESLPAGDGEKSPGQPSS